MKRTAVLLVSHGAVEELSELPAFLRNIRHGRDVPDELAREVRRRYEAIGGASPLAAIVRSVAAKLEARLGVPVRAAARLWKPRPREALAPLVAEGLERVVVVPLAQYSTHVYAADVEADAKDLRARGLELVHVGPWGGAPALLDAFARRIRATLQPLPPGSREKTGLVLTAHSLPRRAIDAGDPYEEEFLASVEAIKPRVSTLAWLVRHAYQSRGAGGGDWLGPDLGEVMRAAKGAALVRLVVAPIGFLADGLEILWDLDVDARAAAAALGLELVRTESLNDADDFVAVLEGLVVPHLS